MLPQTSRRQNFSQVGFNDRASSAVVLGQRWEVCNDSGFNGQCMVSIRGDIPR